MPAALAVFNMELKITPSPANCPASTLLVMGRVSVGVEVLAGAVIVNLPEAVELASAMEPVEVPGIPKTGAIVKAGPAAPVMLFPNTVPPAALLRENVRAGVVVAVATEVVNNGERVLALNEVTVPEAAKEILDPTTENVTLALSIRLGAATDIPFTFKEPPVAAVV